jgi:hypothetical protein
MEGVCTLSNYISFNSISSANSNIVNLYWIYMQNGNYTKLKAALSVKLHEDPLSGFESERVLTERRILPSLLGLPTDCNISHKNLRTRTGLRCNRHSEHFELSHYTIAARVTRTGTQNISAPNSRFLISCVKNKKES